MTLGVVLVRGGGTLKSGSGLCVGILATARGGWISRMDRPAGHCLGGKGACGGGRVETGAARMLQSMNNRGLAVVAIVVGCASL